MLFGRRIFRRKSLVSTVFLYKALFKNSLFYILSWGGGPRGQPPHGCAKQVGAADFGVFFVNPLGYRVICMVICRGKKLTGKFYNLENLKFSGPGPLGSAAAITGLYRILAITLAI